MIRNWRPVPQHSLHTPGASSDQSLRQASNIKHPSRTSYTPAASESFPGPAFWNLVANEVLTQSWPEGVHLQAFADDFIFIIKSPTKATLNSLANEALNQLKSWTAKHNLEISADKSNDMNFNKNRKRPRWPAGIRWEDNLPKRK
ncbi:hypothetical protein AVEN_32770-1 [Araneus ventricosus]|uniref:Reverse transcriptase domain-containing protein n=1 Tax=Araneus ventricosus TaxID=182803 RepID=A0A4Y2CWW9_ARAVE|nr:hypothetical protein AVEN_32770-1 [Araneus ventricosus]